MGTHILSVHDASADGRVLAIDLKDILAALGDTCLGYRWCVLDMDATGPDGEALHKRLNQAPERRLWLSAADLRQIADQVMQTIDAEISGYPIELTPAELRTEDYTLASFPSNRMAIVITAVDSTRFEIYLKDAALADRLATAFRDVRREDPADYFTDP